MVLKYLNIQWFFTLLALCTATENYSQNYHYTPPLQKEDGLKTASFISEGIDSTRLYLLFNNLAGANHKLHSMLLLKDNHLILEEYFNNHTSDSPHDLRSVTKSITSLLMGIAIDRGLIHSIDDPVSKYIPFPDENNVGSGKNTITIRHLLTMSSGLECNDWDKNSKGQEDRVYKKKDWLTFFMELPLINTPGNVAHYCTMGQILATEIIAVTSRMSIDAFAKAYLFDPLGIDNLYWGHTSNKEVIQSGKRLYMTSRDLGKIGLLVLNNGQWEGEQLISEEWIAETSKTQTQITGIDYGLLWWKIPFRVNDQTFIALSATGNGGQYIFIFPELNLIAVFTGGAYNSPDDKVPLAVVRDIFLHTFVNTPE